MTSTGEPVDQTRTRVDDPLFYDTRRAADFASLPNNAPVYRYEAANVWVVSKYDDARTVLRTPDVLSSSKGILLNDAKVGESVADTFYDHDAELLVTLDPPRHRAVRRALASAFTPKHIAAMEEGRFPLIVANQQ
jgi:cytochrome P450